MQLVQIRVIFDKQKLNDVVTSTILPTLPIFLIFLRNVLKTLDSARETFGDITYRLIHS